MTTPVLAPVRVAVVNDYELVVAGLSAALAPYSHRVLVVELEIGPRIGSSEDVDVVLYDTFGQPQGDRLVLDRLLEGSSAKLVVFSWNLQPDLVARTLERGVAGYLSKSLRAEEIVEAIEAVHAGEIVVPPTVEEADEDPTRSADTPTSGWPGREMGLSPRESEVIALITNGYSNREIAERTYLSINSVKTYIRTAYRKLGVVRRPQAVIWGLDHGFGTRSIRPRGE
jgi:two-component system, NarL family, response regulator LiaR